MLKIAIDTNDFERIVPLQTEVAFVQCVPESLILDVLRLIISRSTMLGKAGERMPVACKSSPVPGLDIPLIW